ncbi:hypothetical protein WUBG_05985 [Wuchereria bancrofti]|uniref:Uncharacterized protein n=1 Tax=Wuchereria bancrofti TaxID=6293 RepID=J9B7V0_WUCBA|nr:hypothetical protein WUBG_05985 [Wuchereria bancrofti]
MDEEDGDKRVRKVLACGFGGKTLLDELNVHFLLSSETTIYYYLRSERKLFTESRLALTWTSLYKDFLADPTTVNRLQVRSMGLQGKPHIWLLVLKKLLPIINIGGQFSPCISEPLIYHLSCVISL